MEWFVNWIPSIAVAPITPWPGTTVWSEKAGVRSESSDASHPFTSMPGSRSHGTDLFETRTPAKRIFCFGRYTTRSPAVWAGCPSEITCTGRLGVPRERRFEMPCTLRSEEHTSELQSLRHLVCRLLLEKKKTHSSNRRHDTCTEFQPS